MFELQWLICLFSIGLPRWGIIKNIIIILAKNYDALLLFIALKLDLCWGKNEFKITKLSLWKHCPFIECRLLHCESENKTFDKSMGASWSSGIALARRLGGPLIESSSAKWFFGHKNCFTIILQLCQWLRLWRALGLHSKVTKEVRK